MNDADLFPYETSYLHQGVLIQLSLPARLIFLPFKLGLSQHLEFLQRTFHQRKTKLHRHSLWIHLLRMAQNVKPSIKTTRKFGDQLIEFRQLQNVKLQVISQSEMLPLLEQSKAKVMIGRLRKVHVVEKADRNGRLHLDVVLSLVQLLLMKLTRVVHDPTLVVRERQHLHLDIELSPCLI